MVCVSALWCLSQHLPSYLGFSYLGQGVSPHSHPSWPWTWINSSRSSCTHAPATPWMWVSSSWPPSWPRMWGSYSLLHVTFMLYMIKILLEVYHWYVEAQLICSYWLCIYQCMRHRRCGFNPWVGKFLWWNHGKLFHYSCLENLMDRGTHEYIGLHRVRHTSEVV